MKTKAWRLPIRQGTGMWPSRISINGLIDIMYEPRTSCSELDRHLTEVQSDRITERTVRKELYQAGN